jgi:hypothetical protein
MWSAGNRESLRKLLSRDSIVWWAITSFRRRRRQYGELFQSETGKLLVRLGSDAEVRRWLNDLPARE